MPEVGGEPASVARPGSWNAIIRAERQRVGLTQAQLAARVGLDEETIRKYEKGSRLPPRDALDRILDSLQVSYGTAHQVLLDRGFYHPDSRFSPAPDGGYYFVEAELQAFIDPVPWPVFVGNEFGEVIAANRAACALWGTDVALEAARYGWARPNLFVSMADQRFATRLVNRDEILRQFIGVYKAVPASQSLPDSPGPRFGRIVDLVGTLSPAMLLRVLRLWATTPRRKDKVRWTYPVVWREPGLGDLRFLGVVNPASEPEGWGFNDWIPADPASYASLEALKARYANPAR